MKIILRHFITLLFLFVVKTAVSQTNGSFLFEGVNRSFIVYTPPSFVPGSNVPLVFVLHGFTQTAQGIMDVSGFNDVADTAGFIVVYPNGVGNAWNSNTGIAGGSTANDLGFIAALTDTMFNRYGIDTTRVYSCGFSAGGFMSHRLACESPRCFAAIASVAGVMSSAAYSACAPSRPVPVLQIHGTADAVVSYNGGFGGVAVDDVISKWTSIDVCPSAPQVTPLPNINVLDASTVESNLYSPCSASTEVELLKVIGGGHTWPGTSSLLGGVGTINRDINASGEIWNFFRNRSCGSAPTSVASIPTTSLGIDKVDPNRYLLKSGTGSGFSYDVYDLSGRMVMNGQGNDGDIIDLSSVASGPYVLVLRSGVEVADFRIFR